MIISKLIGILLASGFDNAITIFLLILMMLAFAAGAKWLMAKFLGAKVHGKFQYHRAVAEIEQDERDLMAHQPEDIEEGIKRCQRKGYVRTHTNVLAEVSQLIKEREHRTTGDIIVTGLASLRNSAAEIASKLGKDKYDKLERLGQLKENGILTEEEFEREKNRILNK